MVTFGSVLVCNRSSPLVNVALIEKHMKNVQQFSIHQYINNLAILYYIPYCQISNGRHESVRLGVTLPPPFICDTVQSKGDVVGKVISQFNRL